MAMGLTVARITVASLDSTVEPARVAVALHYREIDRVDSWKGSSGRVLHRRATADRTNDMPGSGELLRTADVQSECPGSNRYARASPLSPGAHQVRLKERFRSPQPQVIGVGFQRRITRV